MKTSSRNVRLASALIVINFTLTTQIVSAETFQAGDGRDFPDICSAINTANPGDIVELFGPVTGAQCSLTTPNLTIKGVGTRPVIKSEGWIISAENTLIENISFEGSRCSNGSCAAIELLGGSVTLRNISITGGDVGVRAHDSDGSVLNIERSEFSANSSNIEAGKIAGFTLRSSYVHDAQGGALIKTGALENVLENNRIASPAGATAFGELVIVASSNTQLRGNVLVRSNANSTAGLIQYVNGEGQPGSLFAERNTFMNAATSGIEFVESVGGDQLPSVRLDRNIFWGDAPSGLSADQSAGASNYFGNENVFQADNDFRLNSEGGVPQNWGAFSTDDSSFPLNVASERTAVAVLGKTLIRSAVAIPAPSSITLTSSLVGGSSYVFSNKVYLASPAPAGGVTVTFTSSNLAVVTLVNTSIVIPAGANNGTFAFKTILPAVMTSVALTATTTGGSTSATVRVGPVSISKVTLGAPTIGTNGSITTNRVELTGPAPAGGMVISLASSTPTCKVPATVTIPSGLTSNSFVISAGVVVSPTTATITARHTSGSQTAALTVLPVAVSNMLLTPASTSGGQNILVKVYLNGPAGAGGLPVSISSSNPTVLPLPTTILVPAGATELGILGKLGWVSTNTALNVGAVTTYGTQTRAMTAIPTQMAGIVPSATTVAKGASVTLSFIISGPAPTGGLVVAVRSSAPAVVAVPASVTIPAGKTEVVVVLKAVAGAASTPVTVTGTGGGASRTLTLTFQ